MSAAAASSSSFSPDYDGSVGERVDGLEDDEEAEAAKQHPFAVHFRDEYVRFVDEEYRNAEVDRTDRPLAESGGEDVYKRDAVFRVNPWYDREATRPGFCRYDDAPISSQLSADGRVVVPNHVFHPVLLLRKQKKVVLDFVYPDYAQQMLQFAQAHLSSGSYRPLEMRFGASELDDHLMKQLSPGVRCKDGYHILPTHIEIASFDSNIPVFGDMHLLTSTPTHSLRPLKHAVDYRKATGETVRMHDWCSSPGVRNGCTGKTGMVIPPNGHGQNCVLYSPSDELNSKDVLMHMNSRMDCVLQLYKNAASSGVKKKHNLVMRLDMPTDAAPKSSYTLLQRFVMYNKPELTAMTEAYIAENNVTGINVPLNVCHQGTSGDIGMYVIDRVLGELIESRMDQASPERYCMNCREIMLVCHFDWDKLGKIAEALAAEKSPLKELPYLRARVVITFQEFDDKEAEEAMKFQQLHKGISR